MGLRAHGALIISPFLLRKNTRHRKISYDLFSNDLSVPRALHNNRKRNLASRSHRHNLRITYSEIERRKLKLFFIYIITSPII